jgi:hypothetical protein
MKRTYLEEDIELIRRYFPGARRTTLRTPFDLTEREHLPGIHSDKFRGEDSPQNGWKVDVLWMN